LTNCKKAGIKSRLPSCLNCVPTLPCGTWWFGLPKS